MKTIKKILTIIISTLLIITTAYSANNEFTDVRANLVNQNPSQVIAGDIVELRIGIENLGYEIANNLIINLVEEFPFELISENNQKIGALQSLNADSSNIQIVKFKLLADSEISAGEYDIKIKIYSENQPNIVKEETITVDVKTKESAEIVYIDKTNLIPGKQETINFVINNVGSSELKDLSFSWENPDEIILPVSSDNSRYVKSIPVGEKVELEYTVIASSNADADLYKLNLNLEYENTLANTVTTVETIAGIYVGGGTNFDIVFTEDSGNEKSFTISNIGSNIAESVTIKIPSQNGWTVNGASSQIIGNLNKGDYTTISFPLTQSGESNILKINVDYTNTMGERETIEKQIQFEENSNNNNIENVGEIQNQQNNQRGLRGLTDGVSTIGTYFKNIGLGILFIAIVIFSFRKYKKSQKKKNNK